MFMNKVLHLILHKHLMAQWVKNLPAKARDTGDVGSIPRLGRSPGGGNGSPLQYSCLENPHGQRSLGGLQSMGSLRVRHNRATNYAQGEEWRKGFLPEGKMELLRHK